MFRLGSAQLMVRSVPNIVIVQEKESPKGEKSLTVTELELVNRKHVHAVCCHNNPVTSICIHTYTHAYTYIQRCHAHTHVYVCCFHFQFSVRSQGRSNTKIA